MKTQLAQLSQSSQPNWLQIVDYQQAALQAQLMGQIIQRDSLSDLCMGVAEYFDARALGRLAPRGLERLLPLLFTEAIQELRHSPSTRTERRVLRALRLLWASLWRGPRCQALARQACQFI